MAYDKLYLLPVAVFVLVPVSFLITYLVAVKLEHVDPRLPYISDTGSTSPESCLFAQFCNTNAALILLCVYIKYRQVEECMRLKHEKSSRINKVAATLGSLSCLGLQIVGNFQETNVLIVHMIGALLCFLAGTLYYFVQCIISHRLPELGPSKWVLKLRQFFVLTCIVFTPACAITGILAMREFKGNMEDIQKWTPEDGGWEFHLVSTSTEWILVIIFCAHILTFVPEFSKMRFEPLPVFLEIEKPAEMPQA